MKCTNINELMSAYIDNEINEVDKAKFEKHIAQCPQCKEEYELLKSLVLECSEIDEAELPEDFREGLHTRLMEAKAEKPSKLADFMRKNRWTTAASAAAAVLIIAFALGSFGGSQSMEQAQSAPTAEKGKLEALYDRAGTENNASNGSMGIASAPETAPNPSAAAAPVEPPSQGIARDNVAFSKSMPNAGVDNQVQITSEEAVAQQDRKIIKNGNASLKVENVQTRMQEITVLAEQSGGYVESSYVDNITQPDVIVQDGNKIKETSTQIANMTIKIPADRFEGAFQSILAMGKVINQSTNTNDVTIQYRDLEARVANLKVQEKNLQEIMTKANTVEDTLKVETELNRVRTEIDIMSGNLKNWDQLVEYSTIYINMTEVKEQELEKVDVPGVWQKAQQGFIQAINNIQNGLERLFVFLVSALPYIAILGAGSLLAVIWIKKKNK